MDEFADMDPGQEQEATGFDALPAQTKRELRKLRKEALDLRATNQSLANDLLVAKYGEAAVAMVPEEVQTFSRRQELAARFAEVNAPAPTSEPDEDQPLGLSALAGPGGLSGTPVSRQLPTVADIRELRKTDPESAARVVMSGKYQQQTSWDQP